MEEIASVAILIDPAGLLTMGTCDIEIEIKSAIAVN